MLNLTAKHSPPFQRSLGDLLVDLVYSRDSQHQAYLGAAHCVTRRTVSAFVRARLSDDLSPSERAAVHFSEMINASIDGNKVILMNV